MQKAAIALNRFGLGAKAGDAPIGDPQKWLLDQLARFDPHPPAFAELPGSDRLIGMLREAREARQELKADAQTPGVAPSPQAKPAPMAGPFREFEAIRPHVLGRFRDMLGAVERHPAMLLYLDQAESVGPDSMLGLRAAQRGRQRGLNENLAREIMELHTLGVRSGYSQADVTEFARALTGWTVGGLAKQPLLQGPGPKFWFAGLLHQPGNRTIMGKRYGEAGEAQAQAVLDDLAADPATARHVATKLARHFAARLSAGGALPATRSGTGGGGGVIRMPGKV